ncbi:hypothetical protein BX616_003354, partial [Lobosporangium transversale]
MATGKRSTESALAYEVTKKTKYTKSEIKTIERKRKERYLASRLCKELRYSRFGGYVPKPDNIYNCDETGFYFKELEHKSYTTQVSKAGIKANRSCRVSILFCINASGTSLLKAESMSALKTLVIGKNITQGIDEESA